MNNMFTTAGRLAFSSFSHNKLRSFLTVLGIIIGITAVILVLSAGQAIKSLITGELEAFGTNYIQIEVKTPQTDQASSENAFSMVGGSVITTLKLKDAEAAAKHPNIANYYAAILGQEVMAYQGEIKKSFVYGTSAAFTEIDKVKVASGRYFTKEENDSLAQVAILGPKVKDKLFAQADPVGQHIKIGRDSFLVIGVMTERGASFTFDMDDMVFIPVKTLQKKILGVDYVSFVIMQAKDPVTLAQTAEDIRFIMRDQHDITDPKADDFAVTTQADAQELLSTIIGGIQALLIVLASISLVVGGIGIMNIMYVSVTERTYEIGLRKAIGARRRDILLQFLIEAILLTLTGATIGFIFGVGLSWLLAAVAASQGFTWKFSISLSGVGLAIGMATIVGVTFGLYPAQKAAKLEPITALRK